jgi:hypothetical protein
MVPASRVVRAVAVVMAGILAGAALAGCSDPPARKPAEPRAETVAVPARASEPSPAAAAGGACQLMDFYAVEQLVGIKFEVAASAQKDSTATCVMQRSSASYPDLVLAVTSAAVSVAAFKSTAVPAGATELAGVGQFAYQLVRPAAGTDPNGPGAAVEVGWLTRKGHLMVVRYRLPAQEPQTAAQGLLPKMADLARFLDPV